ncbi:MAG: VOC family protein [Chloroflexi bacterium]|nr:VOC family protein [Chloroflexota bacterium]
MAYEKTSFLEHTAIRVKDIHWHIRFFKEALGMPVARTQGPEEDPVQVWTVGGVQLVSDKNFEGPEGRMVHLGIRCEDLDAVLDEVYKWGVKQLPQGRNWIELPDGLQIELMQVQK